MNLTMCKKICKECPFDKKSPQGWLGPHEPEDIVEGINLEILFPCHMHINEENEESTNELIESGKIPICRGFLASASKSFKMFGGNPSTGSELRKLQKEITEEDKNQVLNKWEFLKHHKL